MWFSRIWSDFGPHGGSYDVDRQTRSLCLCTHIGNITVVGYTVLPFPNPKAFVGLRVLFPLTAVVAYGGVLL